MKKLDRNFPDIGVINQRVSYDPKTGIFRAKVSSGKRRVGDVLGYTDAAGYIKLSMLGNWTYAHRLAWRVTYGHWPADELDHKNGDTADNRINNLRCATRRQNMQNAKIGNGWHWHSTRKRWQALIRVDGSRKYLGTFDTESEAKKTYLAAAEKYFGERSVHQRKPEPTQEGFDLGT